MSNIERAFVQALDDHTDVKNVSLYGTIKIQDYIVYVQLDGSSELTPVETGMICRDGDRVLVEISNRTAKVINNMSLKTVDDLLVDGTVLSNAIEAKNLKISGGTIDINTSDDDPTWSTNHIILKYTDVDYYGRPTGTFRKIDISPVMVQVTSHWPEGEYYTYVSGDGIFFSAKNQVQNLHVGNNGMLLLDTAEIHGELFSGMHGGSSNYKHCNIQCDCTGNAELEITVHTSAGHGARFLWLVNFSNATSEFTTVYNRKLSDANNIITDSSVYTTSGASARARLKVSCTEAITSIHVKDMRGNALLRALSMATS